MSGSTRPPNEKRTDESMDQCIWMTAGLVRYKLCDRQFECDGCPLDQAFTGGTAARDARPELPDLRFPDDRRYGDAHVWVRPTADREVVRLGIDALAARILADVNAVLLPEAGLKATRGDPVGSVTIGEGRIAIRSPLDGQVVSVNERLVREPALLIHAPYDAGWVCEMERSGRSDFGSLAAAEEMDRRLGYELRHFRRRLASFLVEEPAGVGRTLADGGRPLTDLRQILGAASFLRLVEEVLS